MASTYNPSDSFREAASYLSKASSLSSVSNTTKLEVRNPIRSILAQSMSDVFPVSAAFA